MSQLCDIYETAIPGTTLTLETRQYEDGYICSTIIDEFGDEVDSLDGQASDGEGATTRAHIEDFLLDQYVNN